MNATSLVGAVGPRRGVGALLAIALFALGLFSLAPTQAAHAASGTSTATRTFAAQPASTAKGKVDTSEKALRAAARRAKKNPTARASASGPTIRWEWWGARVSVDREVGCFLAADHEWGYAMLAAIPAPWNLVATSAVKAYKYFLQQQMGSQGAELHFNWSGTLHWIQPIGNYQRC